MGGPGFAMGLAQGLQSGQERLIQMQQLKLQQDYAKSRQKQMEIENQLAEMQLQTLGKKLQLSSQLGGLVAPQEADLAPGAQGPTLEGRQGGFDPQRFMSLLLQAELHGVDTDKFLNTAQAADPTGQIAALREQMMPPQIVKKGIEEELVRIKPARPKAAKPETGLPAFEPLPEEAEAVRQERARPLSQEERMAQEAQRQPTGELPDIMPGMKPPKQPTQMPGVERPTPAPPAPQAAVPTAPASTMDVETLVPARRKFVSPPTVSDENRVAMELYKKPYLELTPGEVAVTNAELTKRKQEETEFRLTQQKEVQKAAAREIAAEGARGQLEVKEAETPLDMEAQYWLDREGNAAPPDWTRMQAREAGFRRISPKDLEAVGNARSALLQLDEYRELAPRLLLALGKKGISDTSIFGMTERLINLKSNQLKIAFLNQIGDPDARRLTALFGAIATVARATGDTANIAVQERKFLQNFFFDAGDSLESANAKLDQAERILRGVVRNRNVPLMPATKKNATPGLDESVRLSEQDAPLMTQYEKAPIYAKSMLEAALEGFNRGEVGDQEMLAALAMVYGQTDAARIFKKLQDKRALSTGAGRGR